MSQAIISTCPHCGEVASVLQVIDSEDDGAAQDQEEEDIGVSVRPVVTYCNDGVFGLYKQIRGVL
jgi:hypothetical protein